MAHTNTAQRLSPRTLSSYKEKLYKFADYCARPYPALTAVDDVTASTLREFLLHLEDTGHNPGGMESHYGVLSTFLRWYEAEVEPENWHNPIRKVKRPRVPEEILEPVALSDVARMLEQCRGGRVWQRDRAVILTLLDTGARASELLAFDLADLDPVNGELTIRKGKGGKGRAVFVGRQTRKALRAYLKKRGSAPGPLFLTIAGNRLDYDGLRTIVKRRARAAGISPLPTLHGFRRAFALEMLRNGADLLSLQRLLGHANLSMLKRYVKQTTGDLRAAHAAHGPVDRGF